MSAKPHPSLIEGEQLTLTCQANQATKEIQWRKDDVSVTARANIEQIGSHSTLVIEKVLTSDSGKYSCKAVNKAGSASSSVDIRVTGMKDEVNVRFSSDSVVEQFYSQMPSFQVVELSDPFSFIRQS